MMKKTNRRVRRIFLLVLTVILCVLPAFSVYASSNSSSSNSWRPEDDTIYSAGDSTTLAEDTSNVLNDIGRAVGSFVGGTLGALLSPVFIGITDALYSLLTSAGISLNSIIYGKVGGASDLTGSALFTFELTEGNIYGAISMAIYNVLLAIFVILIICVILFRLTMLIYNGQDGQSRSAMKNTLKSSVISIIAIFMMPKVLDFVLYIRDVILYTIMTSGTTAICNMTSSSASATVAKVIGAPETLVHTFFGAGGANSISEMYRSAAYGSLFNSIMYFASVLLTLYFAFIYVSIALTFSILFVMFPLVCVIQAATGGNRLKEWCNEVLGLIMIPVLDSILLLFPLAFGIITSSLSSKPAAFTLIEFALCASIIPARGFIRAKLGFGQPSAMERSGIGAALGAMRLAASVIGAAKGISAGAIGKKKEAASLEDAAQMDREMLSEHESQANSTMDAMEEKSGALVDKEDTEFKGYDAKGEKAAMEQQGLTGSARISKAKESIDNYIQETDKAMAKHQDAISDAQAEVAAADNEMARLTADNENGQNALQIEAAKKRKSDAQSRIQYANGRIAKLRELKRDAETKSASLAAVGGDIDPGERAVLDSHANIENFDSYAFRNISPERRAELEEERARVLRVNGSETLTRGLIGAGVGGFVGGAAATFMGPTAMMYGSSMGISLGSELANFSVNANYEKAVAASSRGNAYGGGTSGPIPINVTLPGGSVGGGSQPQATTPNIDTTALTQAVQQAVAGMQAIGGGNDGNAGSNYGYVNIDINDSNKTENYADMVMHGVMTNPALATSCSRGGLYAANAAYSHELSVGVGDSATVRENALKKASQAYAESASGSMIASGMFGKYEAVDVNGIKLTLQTFLEKQFESNMADNLTRTDNVFGPGSKPLDDGSFFMNGADVWAAAASQNGGI